MRKYAIIIEKTNTGYSAYVPDLLGCVATGSTLEQVEQFIYEGIQMHIEGMIEDGLPIPEPTTQAEMLLIPA
jgi:predicted RNase H-like HicB family nuclease